MFEVIQTDVFTSWHTELADRSAAARVLTRIRRLQLGNMGDAKSVGAGVSELRIDYGPGYRLYFTRRRKTVIVLLCGGDKRSQARDIRQAQDMAKEL